MANDCNKMLKEDGRFNLEKKVKKKVMNAKFPLWEPIEFHEQTKEYFEVVGKMSNMRLNLKLDITNMNMSHSLTLKKFLG
jgi:hypothetical protein